LRIGLAHTPSAYGWALCHAQCRILGGGANYRVCRGDFDFVPFRPDVDEFKNRILAELLILLMLSPYGGTIGTATPEVILATGPSHAVGITMFSDYLLLFEIVGVFLLGAVIGAIVLAKTPAKAETPEPANSPIP
jgi:hypothetical protein